MRATGLSRICPIHVLKHGDQRGWLNGSAKGLTCFSPWFLSFPGIQVCSWFKDNSCAGLLNLGCTLVVPGKLRLSEGWAPPQRFWCTWCEVQLGWEWGVTMLHRWFFCLFAFCIFRAVPMAYGSSQARGNEQKCLFRSSAIFLIFWFLGPHLWHVKVPRLGIKVELQLPAYTTTTATPDLSCLCELHHSSWQCWILNPLNEVRDRTCILLDASQIRFCWATMGMPPQVTQTYCQAYYNTHSCTLMQ